MACNYYMSYDVKTCDKNMNQIYSYSSNHWYFFWKVIVEEILEIIET